MCPVGPRQGMPLELREFKESEVIMAKALP